jgi:hypothetical protein
MSRGWTVSRSSTGGDLDDVTNQLIAQHKGRPEGAMIARAELASGATDHHFHRYLTDLASPPPYLDGSL